MVLVVPKAVVSLPLPRCDRHQVSHEVVWHPVRKAYDLRAQRAYLLATGCGTENPVGETNSTLGEMRFPRNPRVADSAFPVLPTPAGNESGTVVSRGQNARGYGYGGGLSPSKGG